MVMEVGSLLIKKFPPIAYLIIIGEAITVAGVNVELHAISRTVGAFAGGAIVWLWRTDLATSRRVACLLLGICGGIAFSPFVGWLIQRYLPVPDSPLLNSFIPALGCVKLLEAWMNDPMRMVTKIIRFIRGNSRDTKDKGESS